MRRVELPERHRPEARNHVPAHLVAYMPAVDGLRFAATSEPLSRYTRMAGDDGCDAVAIERFGEHGFELDVGLPLRGEPALVDLATSPVAGFTTTSAMKIGSNTRSLS